ncbi:MAG: DUF4982 domain-containing protein [Acetatifactor sp.]|nr:DUF4982 domain-containing protein [Acetatifactor sp.]
MDSDVFAELCGRICESNTIYPAFYLVFPYMVEIAMGQPPAQAGELWEWMGHGFYRDVWMLIGGETYVEPNGLKITTPDVTSSIAEVHAAVRIRNASILGKTTVKVKTEITDQDGNVAAAGIAPLTILRGESAAASIKMYVSEPKLWNLDAPNLYHMTATVLGEGHFTETGEYIDGPVADIAEADFGIRTFRLNPKEGLVMNGMPIKLKGCAAHHDNGPAGSVSTENIEERKIRKLKENGFNALRTAHNPPSDALLRACDKYGMLVMDEFFDNWGHSKVPFDNTLNFKYSWRDDVAAVIDMAYNHPSVPMYSIGNEIADTGSPNGSIQGREIVEEIRRLDPHRYIINAINGMVSVMGIIEQMAAESAMKGTEAQAGSQAEGQEAINSMMSGLGDAMSAIMTLPVVGQLIEESCSVIDIAGYNYMDSRYESDTVAYPNRIMCGTETFVPSIYKNWKLVEKLPNVIGDFCWTGWDYMGEPSTGLVKYEAPPLEYGMGLPFPALNSQVGEFTITGNKRTCAYYHEIVIGNRTKPFIAVYRPEHYHDREILSPWSFGDTVSSYSYEGFEGKPIKAEVYSDAEEVELFLNGVSLGRKAVTAENKLIVLYDFTYEPGELKAVNYRGGIACESYEIRSASGERKLTAEAESDRVSLEKNDFIFVNVSVADAEGIVYIQDKSRVKIMVEGSAELAGFANDDPCPQEDICDDIRTLYDGTALAVIRPNGVGDVKIIASAEGFADSVTEVMVL